MSTLQLVSFADINEGRRVLGEKASALGYHKLKQATGSNLLTTLRDLDIRPFTSGSVDTYKASKEKIGWWSGKVWAVRLLVLSFLLAPLMAKSIQLSDLTYDAAPFSGLASHHILVPLGITLTILTGVAIVLCQIIGWVMLVGEDSRGKRSKISWRRYTIQDYQGTIPEFALNKMVQIAAAYPEARFQVDQLEKHTENWIVREPDPFLVVYAGNEQYYIEVWDEKEYEKTL